ncbi:MAG: hypothetical protein WC588_05610 [Candidatus Micrarchaeia archaeon]
MKVAALAFALLLIGALAHADVIQPNTHPVDRCVKVINVDSYPDIYLIAEVMGPGGGKTDSLYIIRQGECLTKGYKFNELNIYWAKKIYIDYIGGVGKLDTGSRAVRQMKECIVGQCVPNAGTIDNDNLHFITSDINPYGGYLPDSDPKTSETIEYRLECTRQMVPCLMAPCEEELSCKLAKVKETTGNGGDMPPEPPGNETHPKPQNPAPTPLEPLQSFWCWLMGVFGGKC